MYIISYFFKKVNCFLKYRKKPWHFGTMAFSLYKETRVELAQVGYEPTKQTMLPSLYAPNLSPDLQNQSGQTS